MAATSSRPKPKLSRIALRELNYSPEELRAWLISEEAQGFEGWDFSYLEGRWHSEQEPWNYRQIVLEHLGANTRLLDMGTGGGEFLLSLGHEPRLCSVTEAYPPNLELCYRSLAPLGITVMPVDESDQLNFPSGSFDLVINRHESYDLTEVNRVLIPGGSFITQQVGGYNDADLVQKLRGFYQSEYPDHDLTHALEAARVAGLEVLDSASCRGKILFYDLGALVYFAKAAPWEFAGFSVEADFERLLNLREELSGTGAVAGTEERFFMIARKPVS